MCSMSHHSIVLTCIPIKADDSEISHVLAFHITYVGEVSKSFPNFFKIVFLLNFFIILFYFRFRFHYRFSIYA